MKNIWLFIHTDFLLDEVSFKLAHSYGLDDAEDAYNEQLQFYFDVHDYVRNISL